MSPLPEETVSAKVEDPLRTPTISPVENNIEQQMLVGFSALICIPLSKLFMDAVYPYLISNVATGSDLTFECYAE